MLTVAQAHQLLESNGYVISSRRLQHYCKSGRITAVKNNKGQWELSEVSLFLFLKNNPTPITKGTAETEEAPQISGCGTYNAWARGFKS